MLVYDRIASNKRASWLLFFFFFLIVIALGFIIGELFGGGLGLSGMTIALIFSIIFALFSYYYSDSIVLSISSAQPADPKKYAFLYNTVEGLAIASGLPMPRIFIIEDTAPNAFATGRSPDKAVICVTTGLLQKMNRLELEGVLAHEMSHIKNFDVRFMTLVVVLVGLIALMADIILRSFFYGSKSNKDSGKAGIIIITVGLIFAIITPIIAQLIKLAISRKREFLADADAALLTRYPDGLASALKKLEADKEPLEAANKATAHLYIVNPLKEDAKGFGGWLEGLFSTHPPIKERVKALEAM